MKASVPGNPNKSKISVEISLIQRRRSFFWSSPEYEVYFHQIAAALRMRLVTTAKASPIQNFTV